MAAPPPAAPANVFTVVKKKDVRGTAGTPLQMKTNVFPLTLVKKTPFYKHDIRIRVTVKLPDTGKEYERELTNRTRYYDDNTRKEANVHVLHALARQPPFINKSLIYDRAAILFSVDELITKADNELVFTLPRSALGPKDIFNVVTSVSVTLKKATDRYQVQSDDYVGAAGADFEEGRDKSIFELLNVATSQCVVDHQEDCSADSKSRIYILNPADYNGLEAEQEIGDGQILRTSIKKSVKVIEGTLKDGKLAPLPAIVIDVTKTAMHKEALVSYKLQKVGLHPSQLTGAKTLKTYGGKEQVFIDGFMRETVANSTVLIGDTKIKLAEYLKKQYNVILKETNLPAVRDKRGNIFAPETLLLISQPVTPEQNTAKTSRAVILANATPGDERMATINSLTGALHLDDTRAKRMGVQLQSNPTAIKVAGRMLPPKKLVYGNKLTTMGFQRGEKPVFFAAAVDKWAFIGSSRKSDYPGLVETMQKKGKLHGMSIAAPIYTRTYVNTSDLSATLEEAAKAGCTYALIVSDYDGDHDIIKAAERKFGILTQQVKGRTTEKAYADTGSNLALKMNVKNGGINHVVGDEPLLLQENVLVMSLVFDHPSSMSKKEMEDGARPTCPAVIGISSNAVPLKIGGKILPESCQNFCEKFAYANPREWKAQGEPSFKDTVSELIKHEIEVFKTTRGKPAMKIIVYVSGVPEAERGYWSKDGRSLVNDVCHTFSEKYNPATTIITLSTEGCERFVPEAKLPNMKGPDPRIGLVVDTVVVNPTVNEWFLQSAKALKGTPRTIKYTLTSEPTSDAAKMTMDQLQSLTWSLTHLHQYCLGTIGYPAPSRIAADAAKRARTLFKHNNGRGPINVEELNTTLGFKSTTASATTRSV